MPTENSPRTACWECLRRKASCDGTHPICTNCRSTGIVCPGYGDNKPLTWLPMGRVSRMQKPRARSGGGAGQTRASTIAAKAGAKKLGPSLPNTNGNTHTVRAHTGGTTTIITRKAQTGDDDASNPCDVSSYQKGRTLALVSRKRFHKSVEEARWEENMSRAMTTKQQSAKTIVPSGLRPDDWDYIDLITYHNEFVMPNLKSKYVAPCIEYMNPIKPRHLQLMPASTSYALLAANIGYRILDQSRWHNLYIVPTNGGPTAELWQKFYRTIGLSIRALNNEIRLCKEGSEWNLIRTIAFLISAEVAMCHTPVWRAHASGLFSMLEHCGGLRAVIKQPVRAFIQGFLVTMVIFNTTSPYHQQVTEIYNYDIEELMLFYNLYFCPLFSCPGPVFRQILQINCLRVQLGSPLQRKEEELYDIIRETDAWSPSAWIEEKRMPKAEEFEIVSACFQHAVILYGLLAVPLPPTAPHELKAAYKKMRNSHHDSLFRTLGKAMELSIVMDQIFWPLIVAGVEAKTRLWDEREFVERYLRLGMEEPLTGKPIETALMVLNTFWSSNKTGWEDCFDQTYALVIM